MRRLSMQIYLTFVAVLVVFVLLAMIAWWVARPEERVAPMLDPLAEVAALLLPGADRPTAELEERLALLRGKIDVDIAVYDDGARLVAAVGNPLPALDAAETKSHVFRRPRRRSEPGVALALPDGRWLLVREAQGERHPLAFLGFLAMLAIAIALGAYPLVRRLTRRLERLRGRVEALGAGDLTARVHVEGRDEIADLARSFNDTAGRLERLVNAQRNTLASASHELRSPLARMRVAVELLGDEGRPELREQISADIRELDELIGELLLASRLETAQGSAELDRNDDVELLALVNDEAARVQAQVGGDPVSLRANERLLRRAIRNLLENARRYGGDDPIEVRVEQDADIARVLVCDGGAGIPESERERIFEPFYRRSGTRETGEGVGLGLALVRQIAEAHGGRARMRSRLDGRGGSCFELEIPLAFPARPSADD